MTIERAKARMFPSHGRRILLSKGSNAAYLWSCIRLIHPFPVALVVGTAVVLVAVAHHGSPGTGFLARAGASVLMTQIAIGALNDYVDRGQDAVHQPRKPIPSGLVSPSTALVLSLAALVALVPLALSFGLLSLILIGLATFGGIIYDLYLKPTPFSIAGYAIGFLGLAMWIWLIAGHLTLRFAAIIPLGILMLVAGHLAQSFPDLETDRALGHRGLAVALGPRLTSRLILTAYALACLGILAGALALGSWWAIGCDLGGLALGLSAAGTSRAARSVAERKRLFLLIAPGVALLAVSGLLLIG